MLRWIPIIHMRRSLALHLALALAGTPLAACGAKSEEPDGGADDAGDGRVTEDAPVDWDGPDAIDVLVVDDQTYFGDDIPLADARVLVDTPRGRLVSSTGEDGVARFEGFSFAEGTIDVTVIAGGFPVRTLMHVAAWDEGEPLRMPMRPVSDPPESPTPIAATVERSVSGSEVYCWAEGVMARPRHHASPMDFALGEVTGDSVVFPAHPSLGDPIRVACMESTLGDDGARSVHSLVDADISGDATLSFPGDTNVASTTITLRYPDPNPFATSPTVFAFVDDERDDGFAVAIGRLTEATMTGVTSALTLGWFPDAARGTATLRATGRGHVASGNVGWSLTNVPIDAIADPIEVPTPPSIEVAPEGEHVLSGAEWATDVGLLMTVSGNQSWLIVVPRSSGSFRFPAPPPGEVWADVIPGGTFSLVGLLLAWEYDAEVPRNHFLGPEWDRHVTRTAWKNSPDFRIE